MGNIVLVRNIYEFSETRRSLDFKYPNQKKSNLLTGISMTLALAASWVALNMLCVLSPSGCYY